jgi:hypothetical protein
MNSGGQSFDRQKPGRPIAARTLNRPIAAVEAITRKNLGAGIAGQVVAGVPCERAIVQAEVRARITGGGPSGIYSWQGVWGYSGHYTDLPGRIAGTTTVNEAHELNANTAVAVGTYVTLTREPTTERWVFQYDKCS